MRAVFTGSSLYGTDCGNALVRAQETLCQLHYSPRCLLTFESRSAPLMGLVT
jgi:hypothetical protein